MPRGRGESLRVRREFSWGEFLDVVEEHRGQYRSWNDASSFNGFTTVDQALEMGRTTGYQDAIPEATELLKHIETDLGMGTINTFESVFDVAGSEVDMGRYLTGIPECMQEAMPMKVMRTGRVIKVLVPICCAATVPESTIRARGAAVMALVDVFAQAQHPVEIYAVHAIGAGTRQHLSYAIKVQESDQALNMGRIMFALAHPSMLRQLAFHATHMENVETQREFCIGSSYGFPGYGATIDDVNINVENAIVLPELHGHGWGKDESIRWINEQVRMISDHAS